MSKKSKVTSVEVDPVSCGLPIGHKGPCKESSDLPSSHLKAYKQMLNTAAKWFKFQTDIANEHGIHGNVKEVMQDATDLVTIASYIEKGQIGRAANKANSLDTIVRDQIPNGTWKLFQKYWEDK